MGGPQPSIRFRISAIPRLSFLIGEVARETWIVTLDDALNELARVVSKNARLGELRFFAGFGVNEAAGGSACQPGCSLEVRSGDVMYTGR